MADYYLDGVHGSDANGGASLGNAWKTIDFALNRTFATGDTLWVSHGIYILGSNSTVDMSSATSINIVGLGGGIAAIVEATSGLFSISIAMGATGKHIYFKNINFFTSSAYPMINPSLVVTINFTNCGASATNALCNGNTTAITVNCTTRGAHTDRTFAEVSYNTNFSPYGVLAGTWNIVTYLTDRMAFRGSFLPLPVSDTDLSFFNIDDWVGYPVNIEGDSTGIWLTEGAVEGSVSSNVMSFANTVRVTSFPVYGYETTILPSGTNAAISYASGTYSRDIQYRISDTSFYIGTPEFNLPWKSYVRGSTIDDFGRYLQYKITLRRNSA